MASLLKQSKSVLQALSRAYERALEAKQAKGQSLPPPPASRPARESGHTLTVKFDTGSVARATFTVVAVLLLFYFLYTIQEVLVILFTALILSAAINPLVDALEARGWSRTWGVLLVFAVLLLVLGAVVYSIIPVIVDQIGALSKTLGELVNGVLSGKRSLPFQGLIQPYLDSLANDLDLKRLVGEFEQVLSSVGTQLASVAGSSISAVTGIFNGLFNAILVMFLAFFVVTDKSAIHGFVSSLIPARHADYFEVKMAQVQVKIGAWVRGQLLVCVILGLIIYFGLWALELFGIHVPYKETLAVLAGVMELVPYVGALLSMVVSLLIAANVSWAAVIGVVILYPASQFIQGNFISPIVMEREVGLSPIIIIAAMLIGAQFFGIVGIALAIPVATSLSIFVEDYIEREKEENAMF